MAFHLTTSDVRFDNECVVQEWITTIKGKVISVAVSAFNISKVVWTTKPYGVHRMMITYVAYTTKLSCVHSPNVGR
jgi:hypothetical protein